MDSLVNKVKKNKYKGLVILIASLLLFGLIFWIIKSNIKPSIMDMKLGDNLIKVEKDGKYGYIDSTGKLVIDYKYDEAYDFYYKYGIVRLNDKYYLIDEKGNTKFEGMYMSYAKDIGQYLIEGKLYNYKLKRISNYYNLNYLLEGFYLFNEENTSGIINYKGELIYKDSGHIEISFIEKDDYLSGLYVVAKRNDLYGILNLYDGSIVVDYQSKEITPLGNNFFKMDNEYLYVEENRVVAKSKNEMSLYNVEEGILLINNRLYSCFRQAYLDNVDIKEELSTDSLTNKEGIIKYRAYSGVGLMDKNGKVLISPIYEDIRLLDRRLFNYIKKVTGNKVALLLLDGKTYLYSYNNKKILYVFDSIDIEIEKDSSFIKYVDNNGNRLVYNLLSNKYGYYKQDNEFYSNYMVENGKIYNIDLEKIYE